MSAPGEFCGPCTWGNRGSPWDSKGRWSSLTWGGNAAEKALVWTVVCERVFPSLVWLVEWGGGTKARNQICGLGVGWGTGVAGLEGILSLILRSHPLSSPLEHSAGPGARCTGPLASAFPLSPLVLSLAQEVTHSESRGDLGPRLQPLGCGLSWSKWTCADRPFRAQCSLRFNNHM